MARVAARPVDSRRLRVSDRIARREPGRPNMPMTADRSPPAPAAGVAAWRLFRCGLAVLLAIGASTAAAQAALTVYAGARGGGEFTDEGDSTLKLDSGGALSFSVDWNLADGRQAQVFYSYQRSALPGSAFNRSGDVTVDVSYLHLGGRTFFSGTPAVGGGYMVGGVGITYLSPGLDGLTSELRPSMNLGVGAQWPLSKQVSLRGELRGYLTLINSNGGFFCSGGCVATIRGDLLVQAEAMVGLSVGF